MATSTTSRKRSTPAKTSDSGTQASPAPKVNGQLKPAEPPLEETDIFDLMADMPDGDWERHKLYVYRLFPKIDRGGDNHYIGVMQEPLNQERLLQIFGSGRYMLILKSIRPSKALAKQTVAVHRDDCPPKLDPSHVLVDDPANDRYFQTWGRPQATHAPGVPQGNNDATDKLADIVRGMANRGAEADSAQQQILLNAANQAIDMIKSQSTTSGASSLEMLETVLRLKDSLQPKSDGNEALIQLFISQQQASVQQQAQNQELLMSLLQNARAESGGLGEVRGALELLRTVREFTPNVETPWWKDALDAAPKLLQPAASMLQSAAALRAAAKTGGGAAAASPPTAPAASVATAAAAQVSAGRPAAPAETPAATEVEAQSATAALDEAAVNQLLGEFAPLILNKMMQGGDGGEFAEGLELTYGSTPIEKVVAIGEERILSGLRAHTQLWPMFQPYEARLVAFVREFFAYAGQGCDEGENLPPDRTVASKPN